MARGDDGSGKGSGGFKLFGVEINLEDELHTSSSSESVVRSHEGEDECMRKSKSMGNLHEICNREEHHGVAGDDSGYHSDGALHLNSRRAALIRKKGIPWTPSEHRSFLIGLKKLGKGVWKGISKNYVPTRTPTQVASHAQKYFIRLTAAEKKNRRASLFDIPFNESVGLSAHIAASERKPPLSPTTRTYVPDTWPAPYMAGVPGQSFPAAHDMPQTELYRMFNYSYPSYYSVPSSHVNFSAPFMRQKPNDLFLQHHPILDGASQGRPETPVAGNIAICAPFPNQYQTPNGPATSTVAKKDGPILALSL